MLKKRKDPIFVAAFVQLIIAGETQGRAYAQACGRKVHTKGDVVQGCKLWKTKEVQAEHRRVTKLLTKPIEEANRKLVSERVTKLEAAADKLNTNLVNKDKLISFWELVLLVGAKELLSDCDKESPEYAFLVEEYTVTKGKGGVTTKVKMPSKEAAAKFLGVLKGMDQVNEKPSFLLSLNLPSPQSLPRPNDDELRLACVDNVPQCVTPSAPHESTPPPPPATQEITIAATVEKPRHINSVFDL